MGRDARDIVVAIVAVDAAFSSGTRYRKAT